ncbi:MAG: hypothetical protein R3264_04970, partial [Anaerolineae bacterium]|nr:hypothetical protein [Anaerolineae bacterium]
NYENPDEILERWKSDEDWWNMISTAEGGDYLFGGSPNIYNSEFLLEFEGSGQDQLTGFNVTAFLEDFFKNATLEGIRAGKFQRYPQHEGGRAHRYTYTEWVGLLQKKDDGSPFFFLKSGYNLTQKHTPTWMQWTLDSAGIALSTGGGILTGSALPQTGAQILGALGVNVVSYFTIPSISDIADMQATDVQIHVGQAYFNFQSEPYQGGWTMEKYKWRGY